MAAFPASGGTSELFRRPSLVQSLASEQTPRSLALHGNFHAIFMLLIATDEAGYGPKLGPLIVVATAWRLPDESAQSLDEFFQPLREPTKVGDVTVVVDDSKSVYQPTAENPLGSLHVAVSACNHWMKFAETGFAGFLQSVASDDIDSITRTPWLQSFSDSPFLSSSETADLLGSWSSAGVRCEQVIARVITAKAFNQACDRGMNKADLLSESTLGLIRSLVRQYAAESDSIVVYCDRHGGRRYYAGVLQHVFDDATVQVLAESKQQSVYRAESDHYNAKIHFTVKGDTFTPVAMSSMYAKYIRERMMQSLNGYFAERHRGDVPLKATAGYPTDAERYLRQIQPIVDREKILTSDLVRSR